jgi:hypothetical protein
MMFVRTATANDRKGSIRDKDTQFDCEFEQKLKAYCRWPTHPDTAVDYDLTDAFI